MGNWMGLAGIALAIMAAGYVVGMLAERSRLERREYDAEIAGYEGILTAQATVRKERGRHARGAEPAAQLPAAADRAQLPASDPIGAYLERKRPEPKPWTDAASIMPVTMPVPPRAAAIITFGAPLPAQTGRYPDTDTGRLGRLTDTGEIRILTAEAEANIAAMRADNAAWLEKWGAGAAV